MIRKVKNGYVVMSEKNERRLSRVYRNRLDAVKRLRQIEFFKRHGT